MVTIIESNGTKKQLLTPEEVLNLLNEKVEEAGTQTAFAASVGVSRQHIADIVRKHQFPGPTVLEALGLKKVVGFVKVA